MLVLTRKETQSIELDTLDGKVVITVVQLSPSNVRIGISAPAQVTITRTELADSGQRARKACADAGLPGCR